MKDLALRLAFSTIVLVASGLVDISKGEERAGHAPQAQGSPSQEALTVAPQAVPPRTEAPASRQGPASICQDLVAFLQPKPPAPGQTPAPAPSAGGPAPQASGQSAPIPQTQSAPQTGWITVEKASAYADANDLRACQEAAQKMRRAGVALPPGLIALAALKPELLTSGKP